MSLLSKLEYQIGFSDLEKRIADFMINNKEEVANMNLNQLAKATYVSTATISRFCRKLGEKNFNDFRVHFAKITQASDFTHVNFNMPFHNIDSTDMISHNISEIYKQTIESTNQVLDLNELDKAIELLEKAPIIDVFAVGDSYLSALMFQHKMTYINKVVNLKHIPTEQNQQAMYSNKNTVALIISYSGETPEIKKVVERISLNGGTIVAITSMNNSYVREKAKICLSMCSKENIINKIGVYSSKISSDYIVDMIYSLLFKKHYHQFMIDKVSLGRKWDDRRNKSAHEKG
ncbi:MAG: MurR/RpiR family transcriptional regulator [Faecalibacillus sp.]